MKDKLIRGMSKDKYIRFYGINSKKTAQDALNIHKLSAANSILTGKLLTVGLMMSFDLKNKSDVLSIKLDCSGPTKGIIVTALQDGTVKCYIKNPKAEFSQETKTFKEFLKDGTISVIKDLGLKMPYTGFVAISSGEIGDEISEYYLKSEQIHSAVSVGIKFNNDGLVKQSGGVIVQLLPYAPEELINKLEKNIKLLPNITDLLDMDYPIEKIISNFVLKDIPSEIYEEVMPKYYCNCSYQKFLDGIRLLPKKELDEIIEENKEIEVVCQFCNKKYLYSPEAIKKIKGN